MEARKKQKEQKASMAEEFALAQALKVGGWVGGCGCASF
jgi:hypothetical protein